MGTLVSYPDEKTMDYFDRATLEQSSEISIGFGKGMA
jgi:hypothetical protein